MSSSFIARGVHVDFDGIKALDDVDVELREREVLGLIGPNGAGKTTLVNVLSGFQRLDEGSMQLNGANVTGWSPYRLARRGLARTFQGARLFKGLSVFENVEVGALGVGVGRREAKARAESLLSLLGLYGQADMPADSLAYGGQRRLEIARALALRPQFLLLDEPAAGLSELESDEMMSAILDFKKDSDCGVLIIEHDMRVIMSLCDRVHVLNYGKTIKVGTPAEVRADEGVLTAYLGVGGNQDA
ncbi:MAG: ATP-binding cassette domain-containing protein [Actinobacteria bacterium]|nr:ATP-binding cassette domain-containing protein [Actinomycetota bacterium]